MTTGANTRATPARLDLTRDVVALTADLVDIPSVSGDEKRLADAVHAALDALPHLTVRRDGNTLVASTALGRAERVVLAGHLDTVPIADNLPSRRDGDLLHGCGTSDMKAGVAVQLRLAASLPEPNRDVTYVFYDCEEIEAARNGLGRVAREHPDWLAGDLAVLLEPTGGVVEGGCQGTLRAEVVIEGRRAHSARSWLGENAVHGAADLLSRLAAYQAREVEIDGLTYREGVNAVRIEGGVASNVVPDRCVVTINYRFAPDRDEAAATAWLTDLLSGYEPRVVDSAPGALPGLNLPAAAAFVAAVGGTPRAKYGWTDVARFSALGMPAVNFGPGEPNLAHTREEHVDVRAIAACEAALRVWLTGAT
jgi:succinyl-diaminopimelate desuccinylase